MINNYPSVSILIPLYNAEEYFSETMESLLAQTYENIEIIIVDDGSTDTSLKMAREYEKLHKDIKVYTQENSGAQVARNKAFEMSKGEYIQYFDADDIMHHDKILSQIKALKQYDFQDDIVAIGKWMRFFNSIENATFKNQIINKSYDDKFLFLKESWENIEYIIGQSWLISKSLHLKVGKWNESLIRNQDGEFFARVAYAANKIIFVQSSIVYYRKGISSSITSKKSYTTIRSQLNSYQLYTNLVKEDLDEHSLHKAIASLYSVVYRDYYPLDKELKKEVLELIRELGYDEPVIAFKPSSRWIVRLFGVDTGLYLRGLKTRFITTLNLFKKNRD